MKSPIVLTEIEDAIDALSSSKTPGPDGVGAESLKSFKNIISLFLLQLFSHAYQEKSLPLSFTKSRSILIQKSDDAEELFMSTDLSC